MLACFSDTANVLEISYCQGGEDRGIFDLGAETLKMKVIRSCKALIIAYEVQRGINSPEDETDSKVLNSASVFCYNISTIKTTELYDLRFSER